MTGREGPPSALEDIGGGGGSTYQGGEGTIFTFEFGCSGGQNEELNTFTKSLLGV